MTKVASGGARFGADSRGRYNDRIFRGTSRASAWVVIAIIVGIGVMLLLGSLQAFREFGVIPFVTGTTWDPVRDIYGALPYIVGTLLSSGIALILATPVAILTANWLRGGLRSRSPS